MPTLERTWRPGWPLDLTATLGPLARGRADPCLRLAPGQAWWATVAESGPVTLHLRTSAGRVDAQAWGPGAAEALDRLPDTLGAGDDLSGFTPDLDPLVATAFARHGQGWRMLRTRRVLDTLVPTILEQRVTGTEARRAWRTLLRRVAEPAPGPAEAPPLRTPPPARAWAEVPGWVWHRAGVDPGRARAIVAVAGRAAALERLSERPPEQARAALTSLPGVGTWTAAEVAVRAWGDADAVSYGDFHLAGDVVWALTGRLDGTDQDLAELLTPWTGHRARVTRLVHQHAGSRPRRGPRAAITDHRAR